MPEQLKQLGDSELEDRILQAETPLLVDFWAEWCGPCRALAPVLEELAEEFRDRATIVKVNVDKNPQVSARYGIRSIPTLILFRDGQEQERLVGAHPKTILAGVLDRHVRTTV